MKIKLVFILSFIFCSFINHSFAQQKFSLEVGSGLQASMWDLKRKNISNPTIYIRYDNSTIKPSIPLKLAFLFKKKRLQIGAEIINQYVIVNKNNKSNTNYSTNYYGSDPDPYDITTDPGVYLFTCIASIRYAIVNNEIYKMSPSFGIGSFLSKKTTEKNLYTPTSLSYKFSLQNEFHGNKRYFYLSPMLLVNRYNYFENTHRTLIYSGGLELGIGFKL